MNENVLENIKALGILFIIVTVITTIGWGVVSENKQMEALRKVTIDNAFTSGKEAGIKEMKMQAVSNNVAEWTATVSGDVEFKWKVRTE